jgi:hypothetical protein
MRRQIQYPAQPVKVKRDDKNRDSQRPKPRQNKPEQQSRPSKDSRHNFQKTITRPSDPLQIVGARQIQIINCHISYSAIKQKRLFAALF